MMKIRQITFKITLILFQIYYLIIYIYPEAKEEASGLKPNPRNMK
jgi:hypothetical protein